MNDPASPKPVCRQCAAALDADDNYCRRCGTPTHVGVMLGIAPAVKLSAIWESPLVILPMLFFVLGPLALPLLWRSSRFTRHWKIALTSFVVAWTVALVWATWVIVQRSLTPLLEVLGN
jgi:hypothetical protein